MLLNSIGGFKRKAKKKDKETDDINDDPSLNNDDQDMDELANEVLNNENEFNQQFSANPFEPIIIEKNQINITNHSNNQNTDVFDQLDFLTHNQSNFETYSFEWLLHDPTTSNVSGFDNLVDFFSYIFNFDKIF